MKARRFSIYHIAIKDIIDLRAYHRSTQNSEECISFSYEDSLKFAVAQKRNTQLFDALYTIHSQDLGDHPYSVGEPTLERYLYDAIIVEMQPQKDDQAALCLTDNEASVSRKPSSHLPGLLYRNGFTITGIPAGACIPVKSASEEGSPSGERVSLHYVPFITSASMSRKSEYLFVRLDMADRLMTHLSLGLLRMDEKGQPYASTLFGGSNEQFLSPAKLSAYIGLALSDGQSVKEMQAAWTQEHGDKDPAPEIALDSSSVICVRDEKSFPLNTAQFSPYVWKMHPFSMTRPVLNRSYAQKSNPSKDQGALLSLLLQLRKSKTLSKNLKALLNETALQEWTSLIDAVTMDTLVSWADDTFPIGLPDDPQWIEQNLLRCAFAIPLRLAKSSAASEAPAVDSISVADENALSSLRDELKSALTPLFSVSDSTHNESLKGLITWAGLRTAPYWSYTLDKKDGSSAMVLRLSCSFNRDQINEALKNASVKPADDQEKLCELFALLDRKENAPDGHDAGNQFLTLIKDNATVLRDQWITALSDLNVLPTLNKSLVPRTSDTGILMRSLHGYAFVYALVLYLKTADPAEAQRLASLEDSEENRNDLIFNPGSKLKTAVETLFSQSIPADGTPAGSNSVKYANALFNSVHGPAGKDSADFITCRQLRSSNADRNDPAACTLELRLETSPVSPFMAKLTAILPENVKDEKEKKDFFEDTSSLFDGCGFADDTVFNKLERLMTGGKSSKGRYNALIIRLPFIKGLLIRLNWQAVLREKTGNCGNKIIDVFGFRRPLNGAHVLLTESMFKGLKQFKQLEKAFDPKAGQKKYDPWADYWKRIKEYGFSLLIAGRNSPPSATTRLNYQWIASSAMDSDTLLSLVSGVLAQAVECYVRPNLFLERFAVSSSDMPTAEDEPGDPEAIFVADTGEEAPPESPEPEAADDAQGDPPSEEAEADEPPAEEGADSTEMELLNTLPEFARTAYMRKEIDSRLRALVLDMMRGRIPLIQGDVRFIVPDLDAMLESISRLVVCSGDEPTGESSSPVSSPINACGKEGLGYYYAPSPQEQKYAWVNSRGRGRPAVLLRNPHLSAGEDVLALPLEGDELLRYEKTYGHLHGVCMISMLAFYTMNGGDSDGDRASIVTQNEVVDAARKSVLSVNKVLSNAVRLRESIISVLKKRQKLFRCMTEKQLDSYSPQLPEYIDGLLMLAESLPKEFKFAESQNVCPPLIYSGSGMGGALLSPANCGQGSRTLKNAFYKAYQLTAQQSVGIMSLSALDNAANAYLSAPGTKTQKLLGWQKAASGDAGSSTADPDQEALSALYEYLCFWRVTSGALQNALEIDMAKTSVKPYAHAIQNASRSTDAEFFGARRSASTWLGGREVSLFRAFRNAFVKKRQTLIHASSMQSFDREVSRMLEEIRPSTLPGLCHPLELLPFIVWKCWEKNRTRLPKMDSTISFPELFQYKKDRQKANTGTQEQMLNQLQKYAVSIAARNAFARRRAQLATSYTACLRYVLQRYPLTGAFKLLNDLFSESADRNPTIPLSETALSTLDSSLRDEKTLARFVWEKDKEIRREAYRDALNVTLAPHSQADTAFLSRPSDIYLFKQYVKYRLQEKELVLGANASADGIRTVAALRSDLLSASRPKTENEQEAGCDVREELYSLCISLLAGNRWYKPDKASQHVCVMSEFLMVHLLGDYLVEKAKALPKLPNPEHKEDVQEQTPPPEQETGRTDAKEQEVTIE